MDKIKELEYNNALLRKRLNTVGFPGVTLEKYNKLVEEINNCKSQCEQVSAGNGTLLGKIDSLEKQASKLRKAGAGEQ